MKAVERAYEALKEGIFSNRFAPGSRITEQEISNLIQVSRTPVREALRRLQSEGLVTVQPNHGAVVTPVSREEAEEIFELRGLLESYAAQLAAARATDAECAELRRLAELQHQEAQRDQPDLATVSSLNADFHTQLFAAAHNVRLGTILRNLMDPFLVMRTFRYYSREALQRSAEQHLELVRMLEARDPDSAAAVMKHHVLAARREFRQNA